MNNQEQRFSKPKAEVTRLPIPTEVFTTKGEHLKAVYSYIKADQNIVATCCTLKQYIATRKGNFWKPISQGWAFVSGNDVAQKATQLVYEPLFETIDGKKRYLLNEDKTVKYGEPKVKLGGAAIALERARTAFEEKKNSLPLDSLLKGGTHWYFDSTVAEPKNVLLLRRDTINNPIKFACEYFG